MEKGTAVLAAQLDGSEHRGGSFPSNAVSPSSLTFSLQVVPPSVTKSLQASGVALVFFDFDKTLLRRDSGRSIAIPMFRRGLVRLRPAMRFGWNGMLYLAGLKGRAEMQEIGYATYAGMRLDRVVPLMEELWSQAMEPTLSGPVVSRLREHQAAGDVVVLMTASPAFVAQPTRAALGFDAVEGTRMEVRDGVLTGAPVPPLLEGAEKARRAAARAAVLGLGPEDCVAYTDSVADLELLEFVGRPVAVGPDKELRAIALDRGWEVLEHHEPASS